MPTIFSHIAVPIAAAVALGSKRIPPSMLLAGMVAAVLPDFDGIAFKLGIHYGGIWGHRGFTHTLGFALVAGLIGMWLARYWKLPAWQGYAWIALCVFSHPLLDTLTNGGVAIPLYWPFSEQRFFSPWRPVEVSPVSFSRFFTHRGADVLLNEVQTIWLPLMAAALPIFALRHFRKNQ
jgi:inner membrane protein